MGKSSLILCVLALAMLRVMYASSDAFTMQVLKPQSYLDVQGGYRIDSLQNEVNHIIQNNFKPDTTTLKLQGLSIAAIGVKMQCAIYSHWYLKGFYSYGKIVSGRCSEEDLYGSIRGHTYDGEAGLGYLTILNPHVGLAPVGGWGYNQQTMILHHANIPEYEGLRFLSIWNGPWLGLDLMYHRQRFFMTFGYEFHLTDWKGSWILPQQIEEAYSDDRRASLAFGQVVYLNMLTTFIKHWNILIELKYQRSSIQGGGPLYARSDVFFTSLNNESITMINSVRKTVWNSFGVFLNIGYRF